MSDHTPPSHGASPSGSHYQPSLSVVLIIVVLFVGATFLMVRAVSPASSSSTTTTTIAGTSTTTLPPIDKAKVRVQVANSTQIANLAATYTQRLMTQDWDTLPPGNAAAVHATIIYFKAGYQRAALDIAAVVKVSAAVVHPLGHLNPISGASGDDVIVVLGPNSRIK